MRWKASNFIHSMYSLLAKAKKPEASTSIARLEDIRRAMLEYLGDTGCRAFPLMERRILFATDLEGLWYLRGDLMVTLSVTHGELIAHQKIEQLSSMFEGLLPRSFFARHSRLGD
jgi:hypothetical protein